jgi:RNA-directed DNA polymerase
LKRLSTKTAFKRTDAELRARFATLNSLTDVANILELPTQTVTYYAYKNRAYTTFEIPKRRGGSRLISAPANKLKLVQMKLNHILRLVYKTRSVAHGFALQKSIVTNAASHTRRRYVFNIDLRDFFGSIHFGRVRGMFMARPYNLGQGAATTLAQLCTFNGILPQRAPTSPIITNMICGRLDTDLKTLAATYRCRYTRYADDITMSTSARSFPEALGRIDPSAGARTVVVGNELLAVIRRNGFEVNTDKVRLLLPGERQEVTGLVTNRFPNVPRPYIRQLRGILHAWEKYGAAAAAAEFFRAHDHKRRSGAASELLSKVIHGKIVFVGRVRGAEDPIYLKLLSSFAKLNPSYNITIPEDIDIMPWDREDDLLPMLRKKVFVKDLTTLGRKATETAPVSLLMIDLDHFKHVNDQYGHVIGDEVLIDVANIVVGRCLGKGNRYRYGGEEIAVLLPNFTIVEAEVLAQLIRSSIETTPAGSKRLSVTASIGLATSPDHAREPKELLEAADRALYEAKNNGRNRLYVAHANPLTGPSAAPKHC